MDRQDARRSLEELELEGWLDLLDSVYDYIGDKYEVVDVSAKWAQILITVSPSDGQVERFLSSIEQQSLSTCEICGALGEQVLIDTWLHTRCEIHAKPQNRKVDTQRQKTDWVLMISGAVFSLLGIWLVTLGRPIVGVGSLLLGGAGLYLVVQAALLASRSEHHRQHSESAEQARLQTYATRLRRLLWPGTATREFHRQLKMHEYRNIDTSDVSIHYLGGELREVYMGRSEADELSPTQALSAFRKACLIKDYERWNNEEQTEGSPLIPIEQEFDRLTSQAQPVDLPLSEVIEKIKSGVCFDRNSCLPEWFRAAITESTFEKFIALVATPNLGGPFEAVLKNDNSYLYYYEI